MDNYFQPDCYHFSEDSTLLAHFAHDCLPIIIKNNNKIIDICAGCGVVGLEFIRHRKESNLALTFLEMQEVFYPYLEKNINAFRKIQSAIKFDIKIDSFVNVNISESFDIFFCNPPYFRFGHGKKPLSLEREICRFRSEHFLDELFNFIHNNISQNGSSFFSFPTKYRCDLIDASKKDFSIEVEKERSGVSFFFFSKLNKN